MVIGTSPVTASSTWRLLEYGTCSSVVPVSTARLAPAKCACVPTPEEPYDTLPGLARAYAISSFSDFVGNDGCEAITSVVRHRAAIGVRSMFGSIGFARDR